MCLEIGGATGLAATLSFLFVLTILCAVTLLSTLPTCAAEPAFTYCVMGSGGIANVVDGKCLLSQQHAGLRICQLGHHN